MSAKEIDMGFYCPHIAMDLLKTDDELYIYGPSVMNSEVIVSKKTLELVKTVGYSKNRAYLLEKSKDNYGLDFEGVEVNKGIGYFLETEEIDGAIVGTQEAVNFENYNVYPVTEEDYISYVLVLRKGVENKGEFREFLVAYNRFYEEYKQDLPKLLGIENVLGLKILDLGGLDGY